VLPKTLTPEEEACKRAIYDKIPPRRRRFIDKMGYDNWDPFQKPFDPIDIRIDSSKRTSQQLMQEFLQSLPAGSPVSTDYSQGAWEMCVGVINASERFKGMFDFVQWYARVLDKEGRLEEYTTYKGMG